VFPIQFGISLPLREDFRHSMISLPKFALKHRDRTNISFWLILLGRITVLIEMAFKKEEEISRVTF
jgi:hypothetical protein